VVFALLRLVVVAELSDEPVVGKVGSNACYNRKQKVEQHVTSPLSAV